MHAHESVSGGGLQSRSCAVRHRRLSGTTPGTRTLAVLSAGRPNSQPPDVSAAYLKTNARYAACAGMGRLDRHVIWVLVHDSEARCVPARVSVFRKDGAQEENGSQKPKKADNNRRRQAAAQGGRRRKSESTSSAEEIRAMRIEKV